MNAQGIILDDAEMDVVLEKLTTYLGDLDFSDDKIE